VSWVICIFMAEREGVRMKWEKVPPSTGMEIGPEIYVMEKVIFLEWYSVPLSQMLFQKWKRVLSSTIFLYFMLYSFGRKESWACMRSSFWNLRSPFDSLPREKRRIIYMYLEKLMKRSVLIVCH
jgi:hypothetical protein